MQYDTAGQPMEYYDMCAFCELDTGGRHQVLCPCYQPPRQLVKPDIRVSLTWQGMEDIKQGRFSYPEPFVQLFVRCPHCGKDMQFDGYRLTKSILKREF